MRVLAVALAASLPAQHVTISSTWCTDNQMVAFWDVQGPDVVINTQALTLDWFGTFGFAVLTVGNIGCSTPLPLGPSCFPSLTTNDIPGPMIFDPSSVIAIVPTGHQWFTMWTHSLHLPVAMLSTTPLAWTSQVVTFDAPSGCWHAMGNAMNYSATL